MGIEIPDKLKKDEIRFVLVEKGGKRPFESNWQNKYIKYDNSQLNQHLKNNGNYGVIAGGKKNLIIIDFDNKELQDKLEKQLPQTFTVKTGSGLHHKYYFSDKAESFKIFTEDMDTLADVQGEGKQAIAPNSIHPNGNKYEIIDNSEIAYIPYSEVEALIKPYDKKPQKEKKQFEKPRVNLTDDFLDKIKSNISFEQVLSSFGLDTNKNPTKCPFHSSKGGKCLGYNWETGHCFHCDGSWNIFSFVKEYKNCDFKEALEYLANLGGLKEELEENKKKYLEEIRKNQEYEKEEIKSSFLSLIKDKKFGEATEEIVDYIKNNYHIYTTKDDNKSEMWIYKNGIYVPEGKSEIKTIMRDILDKWYNAFYYNQVMNKLEPDTFIDSNKFFNYVYKDEVPVQNGILNIFTRELQPFTPEKIFFNKLPVEYNPEADCPQIDKFLSDVLKYEDDRKVFYEMGGFTLLKEYKFEKAFMLIGDGRNGKDKSLELIKRTIGMENCCAVPLSSLVPDSFVISEFFGKMANIAGEIGSEDLKDTTMFKALTGRSLVSGQRKFLPPINFVNYAKFVFACNELPFAYDNSRGFWDRWVLLEYPYIFVSKEEYEQNKDNLNYKIRDENIIEKITTPNELSGLLNRFLDGLNDITYNKKFSTTKGSEEVKTMWIRKSNSVMAFCMDMIQEEYDAFITKKQFRKKYV
ncbi:MAG TPA: phage/plasmid primase, P4 family, partial [Candidatus Mcinerneyibacterium sp.]|nr:phage/plasmid primase, P4 family [Candidatus Mcinerneyibacterium sp.]